jgi:hypothetical protein
MIGPTWIRFTFCCAFAAALASCSTATAVLTPTGDPGGRVLEQLRPIRNAIPKHGVVINYAHYQEPHMDSCDGRPGTQGWNEVVVQVSFNWNGKNEPLMYFAAVQMAKNGWVVSRPGQVTRGAYTGPPYAGWSKRLQNGTTANASLELEDYGSWTLIATAPPVGRQVSGC